MTSMTAPAWEQRLLDWAYKGMSESPDRGCEPGDRHLLRQGYVRAEAITREHSKTFYMASRLLPGPKRLAARALYAFCRITDDTVDRADGDAEAALALWRRQLDGDCHVIDEPTVWAWADARANYGIPWAYADQLITGVARDLTQKRYETFDELTAYCYGVASTVGLMAMHITGFSGPEAIPYAVKLGVALQLTNILRDVGEDWAAGRLYLPLEDLARFGLSEADVAAGVVDDRWRALMRFQIARVHALYEQSLPGIAMLHRDGRFAIGAAGELYRGILDEIERLGMDVFHHRAHVTARGKLRRLPGIWWRSSVAGYRTIESAETDGGGGRR